MKERFLVNVIADYSKDYPDVKLDVDFDDKFINVIEEFTLIRIGKLKDSGLIALFSCNICAKFINKYGEPSNPEDLIKMPSINYKNFSSPYGLSFKKKKPKKI